MVNFSGVQNVQYFTFHAEVPPSVPIEETLSKVCDDTNTGQVQDGTCVSS